MYVAIVWDWDNAEPHLVLGQFETEDQAQDAGDAALKQSPYQCSEFIDPLRK